MKKCLGVLVGILMLIMFNVNLAQAAILLQQTQYDTACCGVLEIRAGSQFKTAQSFKENVAFNNLNYVTLRIKRSPDSNLPDKDLRISIQTSSTPSGGGTPSGTILAWATIPTQSLTTSWQSFRITLSSPLNLSANTEYWIVGDTTPSNLIQGEYHINGKANTNPYGNGKVVTLLSSGWDTSSGNNHDMYFILESYEAPPPPPVAPSLRLPFRSGESWQVTCGYNNQGGEGCIYHDDAHNSYYALDFDKPNLAENQEPGEPVLAPVSGKITLAGLNGGFGYSVKIGAGNGYEILLAHLRYSPSVKVGQYVFQGEQVGIMGGTGNNGVKEYNDHIHMQVYYNGNCKSNVPESKPEPMSEQTNFTAGQMYTSDNVSPVAIYHFDSVSDSSGNSNHPAFQPNCLVQGCITLNGTVDEYLQTPDSTSLQTAGDMSIVLWLKPENVGSGRTNPLDKAYFGEFSLVIENDGSLSYYHGQSTSNYFSWMALTPGSIANNQGIRVVITRNSATNTVKSYVNGSLVSTYSGYTPTPLASTNPIRIGLGNTNAPYKGKQDEIAIYPRVLTDNEVNNDYYASAP